MQEGHSAGSKGGCKPGTPPYRRLCCAPAFCPPPRQSSRQCRLRPRREEEEEAAPHRGHAGAGELAGSPSACKHAGCQRSCRDLSLAAHERIWGTWGRLSHIWAWDRLLAAVTPGEPRHCLDQLLLPALGSEPVVPQPLAVLKAVPRTLSPLHPQTQTAAMSASLQFGLVVPPALMCCRCNGPDRSVPAGSRALSAPGAATSPCLSLPQHQERPKLLSQMHRSLVACKD